MKKYILSLIFVLVTGASFMNASSKVSEIIVLQDDCLQEAWDFGTMPDETEDKDFWEWYWTNWYYENFCEE